MAVMATMIMEMEMERSEGIRETLNYRSSRNNERVHTERKENGEPAMTPGFLALEIVLVVGSY